MERVWTEEQRRAIDLGGDLLVSAAAGAGKTAVLTERIARLISEGVPVERLLVVTFTNAAAAEMKQRISERLKRLADEEPDPLRAAQLLRASAGCERANISTLHSFCMSVLRRNYHAAGVDPAFKVLEPIDAELLAVKAMDEILEERFAENETEPDEAFGELLKTVRTDDRLEKLIRRLYNFAMSRPDPEAWLSMAVSVYSEDFPSASERVSKRLIAASSHELRAFMDEAKLLRAGEGAIHPGIARALDADLSFMVGLTLQKEHDDWSKALKYVDYERLSWNRGTPADEKDAVNAYRKALKNEVEKLQKRFSYTLAEESRMAGILAKPVETLCELTRAFAERFAELKEEAGAIDFSDMEQLALRVLADPAVRNEYRERFHSVFVDEYQDVNPAQEAILEAVSHGNRFMVGDVKQSIYRFRQAEPAIFMEKYTGYKGQDGHFRVDLNRNFRSRTAVLDAVNLLFSRLMKGEAVGEIDYSDNAALISGQEKAALADPGEVEILFVDPESGDGEGDEPDGEDASLERLEASYAAERILDIMQNGSVEDKNGPRPYRFSDFAVLMRSMSGVVSEWISAFSDRGIPCVTANGEGFYESVEVRLFMNLLRVIDNRRQDIPLLAVMRSPIFGFTEDELARIRAAHKDGCVLDAVMSAAEDPASPTWSIRCRDLLLAIDRWRARAAILELGDLAAEVLDETRLSLYVSALKGGGARTRNLDQLLALVRKFGSNGGSLAGFIRFIDSAAKNARIPGAQPPAHDAVRLMTIHASKGLEFDTVIIGDIQHKFNRAYNREVGIFDAEFGIGLTSVSGDTERKSMLQKAIAAREARRLNAEEMRLLYVAMTRAKRRLLVMGAVNGAEKFIEKFAKPLNDSRIMQADHYADWILGAYFANGVSPVILPNGGRIVPMTVSKSGGASASRGMDEDAFLEWLQNASFLDTDGLKKSLVFRYPFESSMGLPSKLSVTGLALRPAEVSERPRFMESGGMTAADKGTYTHRLLQLIPIAPHTAESVRKALCDLTAKGFFTPEEAAAVDPEAAAGFFASPLGLRLLASPRVEREREFELVAEASALMDTDSGAPIMLQGVIDCCFIEDGEWVLVDYKTTRVDNKKNARTVAKQYVRQLGLYAFALERLTGIPIKEKYVYLLSIGESVEL